MLFGTFHWLHVLVLLLFCILAEFTTRMVINSVFRRIATRRLTNWIRDNGLILRAYTYDRDDHRGAKRTIAFDIFADDTHGNIKHMRVYVGTGRFGLFGHAVFAEAVGADTEAPGEKVTGENVSGTVSG